MKSGNEGSSTDSGVLSNPLSFLHGGSSNWSSADLGLRGHYGYYWSLGSGNTTGSYNLIFRGTALNPQYNTNHGSGFAMRPSKML